MISKIEHHAVAKRGFTLIELLIVVAIIAILAAIAVPNFLEAQTRAKVSRCLSDMRTIRTGLESYAVDNNKYPETDQNLSGFAAGKRSIYRLTTPIAYLTSLPPSSFKEKYGAGAGDPKIASTYNGYLYVRRWKTNPAVTDSDYSRDRTSYLLMGAPLSPATLAIANGGEWHLKSVGPDNRDDVFVLNTDARLYDATNGTVSVGDILVFNDRAGTGKN